MTAAERKIRRLIADSGPLPLSAYMNVALYDEEVGYYMRGRPIGPVGGDGLGDDEGDFITAPEISQMFGELIGAWCIDMWDRMGRPEPFALVELGSGYGTTTADVLRTAASVRPQFASCAHVTFVEKSARLGAIQRQAVPHARMYADVSDVPDGLPTLLLANEFFDALPADRYRKTDTGWSELRVGVSDGRLAFVATPCRATPFSAAHETCLPEAISPGTIVEACPLGETIADVVTRKLTAHGGAALVIDYGYAVSCVGDTLQAMANHRFVHPLTNPGSVDMSTHVNFPLLARIAEAEGRAVARTTTQGAFLTALGLDVRARRLACAAPERTETICRERDRLAGKDAMGDLFKVMAVCAADAPHPAGFDA